MITLRDGLDREKVVRYIEDHNIQTRMLFSGNIIRHPGFDSIRDSRAYRVAGDLRCTDRIMERSFWVGVYPGMTNEMIDHMAEIILEALQKACGNR